ncbi:MAG TPA: helix-turn-helix transcriptional regulator [Thermodesulfobacteriota bacterium]|nr:helix-turn-helix transcriptional regulator [Deltaproteobacteria bacterium]HNR13999.1 helix-turn-helix transcriptional regulator [Thermodesulfobacteriota bacterium]HOC39275.1 helix-turn-helix transcriptional regulator [Thermodesulfobacteriota bacterium]HQO78795.1 helix-turn-helix transcriptional regulator [Thermodesulfobacteriota bacterium]
MNKQHRACLEMIRSHLESIASPLVVAGLASHTDFTSMEIQIIDLIKAGKTSKEIAAILNVSLSTVSFHRNNIRRKSGMVGKKSNLFSYLHRLTNKD